MKIDYFAIDTAGELFEKLKLKTDYSGIIFGNGCRYVKSAGELLVSNQQTSMRFGILSSRDSLPKCIQNGESVFIGFDNEVDILSRDVNIKHYSASSPFLDFILLGSGDLISVFETDLFCLDRMGQIKWKYCASDIITDCKVTNNIVIISFFDSANKTLSIESGAESVASPDVK